MRWLALVLVVSIPALAEAPRVPMGVIEGGWPYVYAAWGAGLFGLVAYAASLVLRRADAPPPGAP